MSTKRFKNVTSFVINLLNNKTIILLNLAEYHLIRRYSARFRRIIVNYNQSNICTHVRLVWLVTSQNWEILYPSDIPQFPKLRVLRKIFEGQLIIPIASLWRQNMLAYKFVLRHDLFIEAHSFIRASHSVCSSRNKYLCLVNSQLRLLHF